SSGSIGVALATQLSVSGTIQDTSPAAVPAPSLTKVGPGTLVSTAANTYTGATLINEGALNIQNAQGLGAVVNEIHTVTLSGPPTGTFPLTFSGKTTSSLSANSTAAQVQAALEALSTIGTGNVSVTLSGSTFTVTFQGALAGTNQPQMTGKGSGGT